MLLLVILRAIMVPEVRGFLAGSRQRDAITQIVSLTQWARARSAADAKIYKLNTDGTNCWVTRQEGLAFVEIQNDFGQQFALPEGSHVEIVLLTDQNPAERSPTTPGMEAGGILFYPDGRSADAMLRLTDPRGGITLIGSPTPAESFRVLSPQEAAAL
jgi:hypothetical protein